MLFCLVFQVVRYSGKVRLQLFHGQVNVLGIHCCIEMCHESRCGAGLARVLLSQKSSREADLDFLIRISERIKLHPLVV